MGHRCCRHGVKKQDFDMRNAIEDTLCASCGLKEKNKFFILLRNVSFGARAENGQMTCMFLKKFKQ
jgi:hypothetical protein